MTAAILPRKWRHRLFIHILYLQPDFTEFLSDAATEVLAQAGALFADRLAYKDAWCLLLHKGRGVLYEAIVTSRPGHNYTHHDVSPLITTVTVPRTPGEARRGGARHRGRGAK